MKTATLLDLRNALRFFQLAEDQKAEFIADNCGADGEDDPACGYEDYDEAMADFNEYIVERAGDLAAVVAAFLDPQVGVGGPAMATDSKEN